MEQHTIPPQVAGVFSGFPEGPRRQLLEIRTLIFAVAGSTAGVGPVTETLKWGEPAYLTEATHSEGAIRLGIRRDTPADCAVLFDCRTSLVGTFREPFPNVFRYEKHRAILLRSAEPLPSALAACLELALTCHQRSWARGR